MCQVIAFDYFGKMFSLATFDDRRQAREFIKSNKYKLEDLGGIEKGCLDYVNIIEF